MNGELHSLPLAAGLDALADGELRLMRTAIDALLTRRQQERKAQALAQIRRLAREHGLDVEVSIPKARRGRPPRAEGRADCQSGKGA